MQINQFNKSKGHVVGKRNFKYPLLVSALAPVPVDAVTWDPLNKASNIVLSNGNLLASPDPAGYGGVFATLGRSSGKYYFEVAVAVTMTYGTVGVQDGTESLTGKVGATLNGWGYQGQGFYQHNGQTWFGEYNACVIQVAVDLDTHEIWWGVDDVWDGDPAAGTGARYSDLAGTIYPASSMYYATEQLTARFKLIDFDYTPPSAFSAWES